MTLTPHELKVLAELVAEQVSYKLARTTRLVDRVELAKLLGVSTPTIERLSAAGEIPLVRLGRRVLYDPAAVIAARSEWKGSADHG